MPSIPSCVTKIQKSCLLSKILFKKVNEGQETIDRMNCYKLSVGISPDPHSGALKHNAASLKNLNVTQR